jgi:hypothetical protein
MNIEHRTSNVQHRIMYSVNLKKTEQAYSAEKATEARSEYTQQNSAAFRSRLQRDSLALKSIKRSVINIGRSMLGVRCSTFNLFTVPAVKRFQALTLNGEP